MSHQLPPLPEPDGVCEVVVGHKLIRGMQADIVESRDAWGEEKVRAYAEQAIASVKREPLNEMQIASIYATRDRTPGASFADLFRDIEAAHGITGRYKELK